MRTISLIAAALSLVALPAAAETAHDRAACFGSVVRLCPTAVLHGDRDGAKACLLQNLTRAAPACQAAVRAALSADAAQKPPSAYAAS